MRKYINEGLKIFGIAMLVTGLWQGLEFIMIGKIMPNNIDSIIAIILSLSLYGNLKTWNKSN